MTITNLKVGETYKNYRELCSALDEPVKTSNSKKAQLKEWARYFDWSKEGNKFIITEIYLEPKEKVENRGGARRTSELNELLDEILPIAIMDAYSRDINGVNGTFMSVTNLGQVCGFITRDYINLSKSKENLYKDVDSEDITEYKFCTREAFNISYAKMYQLVIGSLKRLQNKGLISYKKLKVLKHGKKYRVATNAEIETIKAIESDLCVELGIKDVQYKNLASDKVKEQYNKKFKTQLETKVKANKCFNGYDICFTDKIAEIDLTEDISYAKVQLVDLYKTAILKAADTKLANSLKKSKGLTDSYYEVVSEIINKII